MSKNIDSVRKVVMLDQDMCVCRAHFKATDGIVYDLADQTKFDHLKGDVLVIEKLDEYLWAVIDG